MPTAITRSAGGRAHAAATAAHSPAGRCSLGHSRVTHSSTSTARSLSALSSRPSGRAGSAHGRIDASLASRSRRRRSTPVAAHPEPARRRPLAGTRSIRRERGHVAVMGDDPAADLVGLLTGREAAHDAVNLHNQPLPGLRHRDADLAAWSSRCSSSASLSLSRMVVTSLIRLHGRVGQPGQEKTQAQDQQDRDRSSPRVASHAASPRPPSRPASPLDLRPPSQSGETGAPASSCASRSVTRRQRAATSHTRRQIAAAKNARSTLRLLGSVLGSVRRAAR